MTSDNPNYTAWKNLQVQINANKAEKYNFSKTPAEKAELATAKENWRGRMRLTFPNFTKRDWSYKFSQAAQK